MRSRATLQQEACGFNPWSCMWLSGFFPGTVTSQLRLWLWEEVIVCSYVLALQWTCPEWDPTFTLRPCDPECRLSEKIAGGKMDERHHSVILFPLPPFSSLTISKADSILPSKANQWSQDLETQAITPLVCPSQKFCYTCLHKVNSLICWCKPKQLLSSSRIWLPIAEIALPN